MELFEQIKDEIGSVIKNSNTKNDFEHSLIVLKWVKKLKQDADIALKIAALCHDIDRSFPKSKVTRDGFNSYEEYKKEHAKVSAEITINLIKKYGLPESILTKVKNLIEKHEEGGEGDIQILTDADCITFFDFDIKWYYQDEHYSQFNKNKMLYSYKKSSNRAREIILSLDFPGKDFLNTL